MSQDTKLNKRYAYNYSLGQDIKTVLGLDDIIIDFEITPNRPDCLSVIGLAREVSADFNRPINSSFIILLIILLFLIDQ